MARQIAKKRQAKLAWLRSESHDQAVRSIVEATCAKHDVQVPAQLALTRPKDFDLMIAGIEDLLEQAPAEESFGWLK